MVEQRSRILSGAPFITSRCLVSPGVEFLWMESYGDKTKLDLSFVNNGKHELTKPLGGTKLQVVSYSLEFAKTAFGMAHIGLSTWYLLVELKGISATLGYFSLMPLTEPQHSSIHFSRAASEASPATSLCGFSRK